MFPGLNDRASAEPTAVYTRGIVAGQRESSGISVFIRYATREGSMTFRFALVRRRRPPARPGPPSDSRNGSFSRSFRYRESDRYLPIFLFFSASDFYFSRNTQLSHFSIPCWMLMIYAESNRDSRFTGTSGIPSRPRGSSLHVGPRSGLSCRGYT